MSFEIIRTRLKNDLASQEAILKNNFPTTKETVGIFLEAEKKYHYIKDLLIAVDQELQAVSENVNSLDQSSIDGNTRSLADIKALLVEDMQALDRLIALFEPKPRTAFDVTRQILERFDATSTDEIVRAAQNSAAASMIVDALRDEGYEV